MNDLPVDGVGTDSSCTECGSSTFNITRQLWCKHLHGLYFFPRNKQKNKETFVLWFANKDTENIITILKISRSKFKLLVVHNKVTQGLSSVKLMKMPSPLLAIRVRTCVSSPCVSGNNAKMEKSRCPLKKQTIVLKFSYLASIPTLIQ